MSCSERRASHVTHLRSTFPPPRSASAGTRAVSEPCFPCGLPPSAKVGLRAEARRSLSRASEGWQARRESNPQPPVLETGALPIELLAYVCDLFLFLVSDVLPAEPAVLAHLQTLGRLLLVLRRAVVAPFALGAGERDQISHTFLKRPGTRDSRLEERFRSFSPSLPAPSLQPLLNDFSNRPGAHRAATFANGEPRARLERNRRHELARDFRVVARHHHLDTRR